MTLAYLIRRIGSYHKSYTYNNGSNSFSFIGCDFLKASIFFTHHINGQEQIFKFLTELPSSNFIHPAQPYTRPSNHDAATRKRNSARADHKKSTRAAATAATTTAPSKAAPGRQRTDRHIDERSNDRSPLNNPSKPRYGAAHPPARLLHRQPGLLLEHLPQRRAYRCLVAGWHAGVPVVCEVARLGERAGVARRVDAVAVGFADERVGRGRGSGVAGVFEGRWGGGGS